MKVFMLWHGGSGYGAGTLEDLETFETLTDAKQAFIDRAGFDPFYPCVECETPDNGGPTAWVYLEDKPTDPDAYPDRVLEFGPRGGLLECRT